MEDCLNSVCAKLRPTPCDPMDYSLPGSSVHGIVQAGILERVAISSPGDLPYPGIEPVSSASLELAGGFINLLSHLGSP